ARWVATETRRLQRGPTVGEGEAPAEPAFAPGEDSGSAEASPSRAQASTSLLTTYEELITQRPEIESAVARAINLHRGKHGQELLRAALLLADWGGSKTLAILHTTKHGGQSPMVRRLQQPP